MNDKERQRKEAINRLNMLHNMLGIDKKAISEFEKGKGRVPLSVELFPFAFLFDLPLVVSLGIMESKLRFICLKYSNK